MPYRTPLVALLLALFALPASAQSLEDLGADAVTLARPQTTLQGKRAQVRVASGTVDAPFTGVLVRGTSSDSTVAGHVRFREDDGWSDWQLLRFTFSATGPTFVAGYRDETTVRQRRPFELRFTVDPAAGFELYGAGVFDNRDDVDAQVLSPDVASQPVATPARAHVPTPEIIRRSDWGAEPFRGSPVPLARPDYLYLTFHHAAGFSAENEEEGKQQVRSIQDLHQETRGWSDIGYQFLVDRAGNLYQGRPFMNESQSLADVPQLAMGAHVGGENTGNVGLCILGCYHPPAGSYCEQEITVAALEAVVQTFAWLSEHYGLTADDIRGHRDFSSTACPGDNNYALLEDIREAVRLAMAPSIAQAQFAAEVVDNGVVRLSWSFTQLNGLSGYRIDRVARRDTTLLQRASTEGGTLVDPATDRPGAVTYRLYGFDADGIEQLLAETQVTVQRPDGLVLANTFPNPFSDRATVRYYVSENAFNVRLVVYDALGREVAVLAAHEEPEPQWHTATFDAADLAAGTYYVRLTVDDFSGPIFDEARPMILVR